MLAGQPADPTGLAGGRRPVSSAQVAAIVAGTILALAVVAPLTGRGWLLLLDWVSGPRLTVPREAFGLDGGLVYGDFPLVQAAAGRLLGAATAQWVLVAVLFPVASASMGWLVGGGPVRRVAAAALYCVNPFVLERLEVGQVAFLAGYAVLPLAAGAVIGATRDRRGSSTRAGLAIAAAAALIVHAAWLVAVVGVATAITSGRAWRRTILGLMAAGGVAAVVGAHLLVPAIGGYRGLPVTTDQLRAFRTSGTGIGLPLNVLGLYGFWRQQPGRPSHLVAGWPFLLAALLLVAFHGARAASTDHERRVVRALIVAGALGFVLALGDRGPAGPAFVRIFEAIPPFRVMREPQKFVALLALGYSACFGHGVEALAKAARRRWVPTALAVALVLAYTPTMVWGLGGRLDTSRFPEEWAAADRAMAAGEPGSVLVLPWHRFQSFTFTGQRRIRHPAPAFFGRDVIVGDNIELQELESTSESLRSAYIEDLLGRGQDLRHLGALIAPLGVEYVMLLQEADSQAYEWVRSQTDLAPVLDNRSLLVLRNDASPTNFRGCLTTVHDMDDLVARAEVGEAAFGPTVVGEPKECPVAGPSQLRRVSATSYVTTGAGDTVMLPEPFEPGWRAGSRPAGPSAFGTPLVGVGSGRAEVVLAGWRAVGAGWAASAVASVGSIGWLWRSRRRRPARPGPGE